jgi:hypothetical protein
MALLSRSYLSSARTMAEETLLSMKDAFRKNVKEKKHLENLDMDRRIMLKCILSEWE